MLDKWFNLCYNNKAVKRERKKLKCRKARKR